MARRRFISGDQYFRAILENWGEKVAEKGKAALKAGADRIVADAKTNCPVKTGKLRDSIKAKGNSKGTRYNITASAKDSKGYDYSRIVEFHPRKGKPFLIPARDANAASITADIREAVREAIEETNRKKGR